MQKRVQICVLAHPQAAAVANNTVIKLILNFSRARIGVGRGLQQLKRKVGLGVAG